MKGNYEPQQKVGEILRELRVERDLRQEDVAKMLCCAKSTISAYERDESSPNAEIIIAYCKLFDVSADRIPGLTRVDTVTMEQMTEQIDSLDRDELNACALLFLKQFERYFLRFLELDQGNKKCRVRKKETEKG